MRFFQKLLTYLENTPTGNFDKTSGGIPEEILRKIAGVIPEEIPETITAVIS